MREYNFERVSFFAHSVLGILTLSFVEDPFHSAMLQKSNMMVLIKILIVKRPVYYEIVIKEIFRLGIYMVCMSNMYFYVFTYNLLKDISSSFSLAWYFYKSHRLWEYKIGLYHIVVIFGFFFLLCSGVSHSIRTGITQQEVFRVSLLTFISILIL